MPAIERPELLDLPTRIVSERIMLRPYHAGDGTAIFNAVDLDRQDLKRWVDWVDDYPAVVDSERYARRMHAKWLARESLVYGIWALDESELYGGISVHSFDWKVPMGEVGYFLHKDARGRGIATEALKLLTGLGMHAVGLNRMWATCDAANEGSWRLLERVGYKREGHLRSERRTPQGNLRDTFVYAMLAREWPAVPTAFA